MMAKCIVRPRCTRDSRVRFHGASNGVFTERAGPCISSIHFVLSPLSSKMFSSFILQEVVFCSVLPIRTGQILKGEKKRCTGRSSMCGHRAIDEMLLQLVQLQSAEKEIIAELNACLPAKRQ
ncbi:hypothetical protein RB195_001877 [Necator americanus]|uniref:Uncharacterized protein n=1 Tax=Necator americanus TaxID=51031 RepID=A0ABR1DGJ0_NECAM